MSPEIIVAIVGPIATIIVAIIVSIESSRRFSAKREDALADKIDGVKEDLRKEIESNARQLIGMALKTDTLWEIYGEEVIRNARNSGMIASRSAEAPTAKWNTLVSEDLSDEIQDQAVSLADELDSPYDIFVEVWQVHKEKLVWASRNSDISIFVVAGGVLQICGNVLNSQQ